MWGGRHGLGSLMYQNYQNLNRFLLLSSIYESRATSYKLLSVLNFIKRLAYPLKRLCRHILISFRCYNAYLCGD